MADHPQRPQNTLIAAWPGMGNVAVIAAGYLVQQLGMRGVTELSSRGHFEVQHVEVKDGVVAPPRPPRGLLFRPPDAPARGGLTVFLGEAQPVHGAYAYAHALLDRAAGFGAEKVVTFASMASQLHPSEQPRVWGAVTGEGQLDELRRIEVQLLVEGQISGLNGVLLGAAAERGLPGLCLLGEIPYFAAGVGNPKAAKAVLDAFTLLSGVRIDMAELEGHAEVIDRALLELLERLQRSQEGGDGSGAADSGGLVFPAREDDDEEGDDAAGVIAEGKGAKPLDMAARGRIEKLFEEARKDRAKAVQLKQELDRHGVFRQFEGRFLDLFRRAE